MNRPSSDFRGYSGTVVAGEVNVGDNVRVLPSNEVALVQDIIFYKESLVSAKTDQAVTISLDREVDVSRGDILVSAEEPCEVSDQFDASLVWMDHEAGFVGRSYWLMTNGNRINATITDIKHKYNINTLEKLSSKEFELNDIGRISLSLDKPIPFEAYGDCSGMGAFVLTDRYSHHTVGAGMINYSLRRASNLREQPLQVDKLSRQKLHGHRGMCIWVTGLSGSGKSTITDGVEQVLHSKGISTYILDGDNIRQGLNRDLGFTDADRVENIRRTAEVAKLMVDAGLVVLTACISPFRSGRDRARSLFEENEFREVFLDVPFDVAESRDPKGLYIKARRGELPHFTGIDSEYHEPESADLVLPTHELSIEQCVKKVVELVN